MTNITRVAAMRRQPPTWLLVVAAATTVAVLAVRHPHVLVNTTASEPPGLYVATPERPQVGRLVVFHAPEAAFPYVDVALPSLRQGTLLKVIAAGEGDRVCTTSGRLVINGRDRAPIVRADRQGRNLPHWNGCRALKQSEVFVFSDRVPNSFDSRYFGPVPIADLVGVYKRLGWPWENR